MAELEKVVFVYDLDKTLCYKKETHEHYSDVKPIMDNVSILNTLHDIGAEIIIETARNMLTQENDESKVIRNVGLTTLKWLDRYVLYDGVKFGKTCATAYIDDKALRPKELKKIYESLNDKSDVNELKQKIEEYLENN